MKSQILHFNSVEQKNVPELPIGRFPKSKSLGGNRVILGVRRFEVVMATRTEEIEQFEQTIGCALPSDYRNFLLFGPFPVWADECRPDSESLYVLFSLYDLDRELWHGSDHGGVVAAWEDSAWCKSEGLLPKWFLEIGQIYDGVSLGVKLQGYQAGSMWTYSADDGEARFYAKSFVEFMDALHADGASFDA